MLTFVKKDFAAFYEKFLNYYRGAGAGGQGAWCWGHGAGGMVLGAWCWGHGAGGMVLGAWGWGQGVGGQGQPS
jgi:hypothetical protein